MMELDKNVNIHLNSCEIPKGAGMRQKGGKFHEVWNKCLYSSPPCSWEKIIHISPSLEESDGREGQGQVC